MPKQTKAKVAEFRAKNSEAPTGKTNGVMASPENPPARTAMQIRNMAIKRDKVMAAEYERRTWVCTVPDDLEKETMFDPNYWFNFCNRFKAGDWLEIRNESFTRMTLALVTEADNIGTEVHISEAFSFPINAPAKEVGDTKHFSYSYEGLTDKYVIRRKHDNAVMRKGIETVQQCTTVIASELSHTQVM